MEAAVRWSRHDATVGSRFLLVDFVSSDVALHQVDETRGRNVIHHRVAHHAKLPSFGAFDWSQRTQSIIALGLHSGYASIAQLNEDQCSEILTTYRIKQQRKCTSVAFNRDSWLAVGLDKARSDVCLNVYDAGDQSGASNPRASTSPNLQASTKIVNNIVFDSCDENHFASTGAADDSSIGVWDKRRMSGGTDATTSVTVLDFSNVFDSPSKAGVRSLCYSGQRRGRLAIASSMGELKIIDMNMSSEHHVQRSQYAPSNPYGGFAWMSNDCVSEVKAIEPPNLDTGSQVKQLIAFDWMRSDVTDGDQGILILRSDRSVEVAYPCPSKPIARMTARQHLSLTGRGMHDVATVIGSTDGTTSPSATNNGLEADRSVARALSHATVQPQRCRRGYLFDFRKNAEVTSGNWQLQRLWEIIGRFQTQAADDGMVHSNVDLSYIGVAGIWSETLGNISRRTYAPHDLSFEDIVVGLNEALEIPQFDGERTDFPEHRQLCLAICGWKFTSEALETECQELIERGLYYQAIVQAVLHGEKHMALNLFRSLTRSRTIPQNGIGALLASDTLNEAQREMCLWMSADTDDLALKALLTFLEKGDWRDVMKTNYLHLGYRVALGCKYLNDTELSGFLQTETARAIRNGDLEGILLTGLGEQAMDLMQTYLTRTNDLQTAVLATALTNPRYVDDVRWEMWKEVYFQQLQSWRCFAERARFTVQHNRIAVTRQGKSMMPIPKGQVTLRCLGCQNSLARTDSRSVLGKAPDTASITTKTPNTKGPAAQSGTVCLKCGRHLPRCPICMLWLGTPETTSPATGGGAATMKGFLSFCMACGHAYHADHAVAWFGKHRECAVPGCKCACGVKGGYGIDGA